MVISLADLGNDYTINETLRQTANQVDLGVAGGVYRTMQTDQTSIERYGQMYANVQATKLSSTGAALGLHTRYLAQYKEPQPMLQPLTLRTPPLSVSGAPIPLCRLRAGLRFRVQERPDLGNIYIGQTAYTRGEQGQEESCQITPYGVPGTIDTLLAGKVARTWT
jgi:hypothetical protein